jgi:hypothetical protein
MIGFSERAVAFLDVLGFRRLIEEAESSAAGFFKLVGLKHVLESHVRFNNETLAPTVPPEVHPKYIFISDSIIISVPLHHGNFDGLDIVVLKCIEVAQKLLESGYLLRGGISVGKVWHEESNIFGSGYIDAYQTEQAAKHPRIMLSQTAAAMWRTPGRSAPDLCLSDGRVEVVDVIHPYYLRGNQIGIPFEDFFLQLRAHIFQNLVTLALGSEARAKWEWMAGFYNSALQRHSIGTKPFEVLPIPCGEVDHALR